MSGARPGNPDNSESPDRADHLSRRRFAQLGLVAGGAALAAPSVRTINFAGKVVGSAPTSTTTEAPPETTTTQPPTTTTTTTAPSTTTTIAQTGNQGCSHGFWKNNTGAWVGYSTSTTLGSQFANVPSNLANKTFLEALNFQSKIGSEGRLLLQAVAALLNAAHPDIGYPLSEAEIKTRVGTALAGTAIDEEALKDELDAYNNLGCPLDADEGRR